MTINHVIILGCGRSGTSILGELFEHLGPYRYLFEPMLPTIEAFNFGGRKLLAAKNPKSLKECRPPGLAVDLDRLLEVLPDNHKFVWIVRHPLDAICSLKPGISDKWSHNPRPPGWQDYLERPLAEKCARHWEYINRVGYDYVQKREEPHVVRYEDWVSSPVESVGSLLKAIGLETFNQRKLDRYLGKIQDETKRSYHAKHQDRWHRDDHTKRLGRWRENLTEEEVSLCWSIVGETAARFSYSI